MKTLKKLAAVGLLLPALACASEGELKLDHAQIDPLDVVSLQRGAHTFVNYCLNCHSANYMRYNRLRDLGLTEQQIQDNLVFTGVKVGELMKTAMDPKDSKEWFGTAPPDLTVIARSRSSHAGPGSDWLYTYLRSFYRDPSRPTGWNNLVYPECGNAPRALADARSAGVEGSAGARSWIHEDRARARSGQARPHEAGGIRPAGC